MPLTFTLASRLPSLISLIVPINFLILFETKLFINKAIININPNVINVAQRNISFIFEESCLLMPSMEKSIIKTPLILSLLLWHLKHLGLFNMGLTFLKTFPHCLDLKIIVLDLSLDSNL